MSRRPSPLVGGFLTAMTIAAILAVVAVILVALWGGLDFGDVVRALVSVVLAWFALAFSAFLFDGSGR